jgi:Xaa-Pro aminopeptidase
LREGQGILIDCVSSLQNYHGDIGRTVFLGEPGARMRTATRAIAAAWDEIRQKLRPGLRYAQIRELGEATLRKHGYDVQVLFNPHGIGLWHGDDPRTNPEGGPVDLALEEGMVLSVDCPVFDQGAGGTAHLEDLALITAQGSELLNDPGQRTILV